MRFLEEKSFIEIKAFQGKDNMNNSVDDVRWHLPGMQEHYDRTIRYLNVFKLLLNSKAFFYVIAERPDIMYVLIKLIMCKSPFVSILSAMTISSIASHFS